MNKIFCCVLLMFVIGFDAMANPGASNDTLDVFHKKIDSILVELHQQQLKKDWQAIDKSVEEIDILIAPVEQNFPLVCGLVQLHQSYYSDNTSKESYLTKALQNLKGADAEFMEGYASTFLWLIEGFYSANRQEEWAQVDKLFRLALFPENQNFALKYAVGHRASQALTEKNYSLVNILAKYDQFYFEQLPSREEKLHLVYVKWLQIKQRLDQWMEVPYTERNPNGFSLNQDQAILNTEPPDYSSLKNYDFKKSLKALLEELETLEPELTSKNNRSSGNFNEPFRRSYFQIYDNIVVDLYKWAMSENRQSEVILLHKSFLFERIFQELEDAASSGMAPAISLDHVVTQVKNLAQLFYTVGNAEQATETILQGKLQVRSAYTENEFLQAVIAFYPLEIRAERLAGDFASALEGTKMLKRISPKPDSLTTAKKYFFDAYAEARVEEIYTIMAQGKRGQAIDSLIFLLEELNSVKLESEEIIFETDSWTHLQYLTASAHAQKGKYNTVLITEMVGDLLNNKISSEIFYPAQLLALKAKWHETGELDTNYFQNLLFYTDRQLQQNFVFLTAEERMQLYANRLNDIFDLYHQLLFEEKLEKYPDLKQQVISQTLYLKNALADGNLIPDEILSRGYVDLDMDFLEQVRTAKQDARLLQQERRLHKVSSEVNVLNDHIQSIWLELLETGMEDLPGLKGPEAISKKLNHEEVYLETVRYTRSLNDSTAVYGAFIVGTNDEFAILNICSEPELLELLNRKNSSPQTLSLTKNSERGAIGLASKKVGGSFKPGDKDLLGQILLTPLWPYLQGKSTLLMVHDGLLNRISFAALQWEEKFLMNHFRLRHFSGSQALGVEAPPPGPDSGVFLAGGLDYGQQDVMNPELLFKPGFSWDYLPGTKAEIKMLQPIFEAAGYLPEIVSGKALSDSVSLNLGKYHFVHLATHGFYFDSGAADIFFDPDLDREAIALDPLFRSGLAISGANNPPAAKTEKTQGFLMGYELANMDLRNCYLVSLSACETGLGDLRNNLGVDGLPRALKIAGAKNLLISLWKVPDEPTAEFMKQFYTQLFSGKSPAVALQETQRNMSRSYPASDWGAFILVE